jgi:hypothetical protein
MREPVAPTHRVINWWPIAALCAVVLVPVLISIFLIEEKTEGEIIAPVGHYSDPIKIKVGKCIRWSAIESKHARSFVSRLNGKREVYVEHEGLRKLGNLSMVEVKSLANVPVRIQYSMTEC